MLANYALEDDVEGGDSDEFESADEGTDLLAETKAEASCCIQMSPTESPPVRSSRLEMAGPSPAEIFEPFPAPSARAEEDRFLKTIEDIIKEAKVLKDEGNKHIGDGHFLKAARAYRRATRLFDKPGINWASEKSELDDGTAPHVIGQVTDKVADILGPCHLNLAFCMLKLEEYDKVVPNCELVLKLSSDTNAKARYRAAKALMALHEYERAQVHLSKIRPEDKTSGICALMDDCSKHVRARAKDEKRMARLMFKPKIPQNFV